MRTCVIVGAIVAFGASAAPSLAAGTPASASLAAGTPAGVTPDIPTGGKPPTPSPSAVPGGPAANLDWQGGPVMHANRTHVIFWNPSNCSFNGHACAYDPGYQALVQGFLANVAADSHKASNVFALTGQYSDGTGHALYDSTFAGALNDTDAAPPNGCTLPAAATPGWGMCLSDAQIQIELRNFVSSHALPSGPTDLYFLVTPEGFGSCSGTGPTSCSLGGGANAGYCGYHNFFGSTFGAPGIYANIPFNAESGHCQSGNPRPNGSTGDPTLSTLSHEQSEAITDPLPGGAGNSRTGWVDGNPGSPTYQQEIGDLCAGSFGSALGSTTFGAYNQSIGTGHYLLQEEWSNEDGGCVQHDETDTVSAAVPGSGIAGVPVTLSGSATDPDGSISIYAWFFGDGTPIQTGQNVRHSFPHPGTFTVTLVIQDVAGQQAAVQRTITIASASITRISTSTGRTSGTVAISTNGPGTVQLGGATASLTTAGTAHFTVALSRRSRQKLARRGTQTVTVTVRATFVAVGGGSQSRNVTLTFRR
jgi:hypothetical protein